MAKRNPATAAKITTNIASVATPRRQPRRANELTAGSIAKERKSETKITIIRDFTLNSTHTKAASIAAPPKNTKVALGTHFGILSASELIATP